MSAIKEQLALRGLFNTVCVHSLGRCAPPTSLYVIVINIKYVLGSIFIGNI